MSDGARDLLARAMALREAQDMEAARDCAARAAALASNDAQIALAHAHISYESWQPAAELFAAAQALLPDHLPIIRSRALALNAEGEGQAADALLSETLHRRPDWIDGHRALATLRATAGVEAFDASFALGVRADPGNLALRLAWYHMLATARLWDRAAIVLGEARLRFGDVRALQLAAVFHAAESGMTTPRDDLFDALDGDSDIGLALCRVRHHLRIGQPDRALVIAEAQRNGLVARSFWPYCSLAWRLLGDDRANWLDGDPAFVVSQDDILSADERAALAATLRRLLVAQAPLLEQSVRGGIQTDRHLFFHPDPAIQQVRERVRNAVARYIANLPPPVPCHPLLGHQRDDLRFEGSWSVLLHKQGFHANHTHNMGWISSALYVELPPPNKLGPAPAGWFSYGLPPPDLALDLPAYGHIEPQPGRLALFPSTMWHGTVPFDDGERLTVAFDVKLPGVVQG